jgi:TetR/AcrR family transcriptional repressor of nem operon
MSRRPNTEARERILTAAFGLLGERGFNAISMDDVASAAGLKKANLFHYFPTKEALGLAVFDYAAARMRADMSAQLAAGKDPIKTVDGMFSALAKGMTAKECKGGCPIGNLALELSDQYEKIRQRISAHLREWTADVACCLEKGKTDGYFRKELKPRQSAEAILSLFEGATLFCKAKKEVEPLENARDMAVTYLKGYKT